MMSLKLESLESIEQGKRLNTPGRTVQIMDRDSNEWDHNASFGKAVQLIIKSTNKCNYECKYCFIEPHVFHKQMSYETLERMIKAFLTWDASEIVHFVWHGGEPLLRGLKFFKEVVRLQQYYDTGKVGYHNSIQTNASRLTAEVLDFLTKHNFRIGMSLDGPKNVNDSVRLVRGEGQQHISAYQTVEEAAQRLQGKKQPTGAIVVLTKANCDHAPSIYKTFRDLNIHMKINPLMKSGLAVLNYEDLSITPEDYARFYMEMFDLWFYDTNSRIGIDPFESHIARLLKLPGATDECVFSKSCHKSFLGISPDGGLFPCGLFQGMSEFEYGNLHNMAPEMIPQTPLWQSINQREKKVAETCKSCSFQSLCYSGCPYHSATNAEYYYQKDYYCEGYKAVFDHIVRAVHADLKRAVSVISQDL